MNSVLSFIIKNRKIIIALILLLIFLYQCNENRKLKDEVEILTENNIRHINNIHALNDSIRIIKDDKGNIMYEKNILSIKLSELENEYNFIKIKLDKELNNSKLTSYTDISINAKDTVYITKFNPIHIEYDSLFTFKLNDTINHSEHQYFILNEELNFKINKNNNKLYFTPLMVHYNYDIGINLTIGTYKDSKTKEYKVVIKSDYPNFKVNKIEGINLINEKLNNKKVYSDYGIGIFTGAAVTTELKVKPVIGIGIYRNMFRFKKRKY